MGNARVSPLHQARITRRAHHLSSIGQARLLPPLERHTIRGTDSPRRASPAHPEVALSPLWFPRSLGSCGLMRARITDHVVPERPAR